MLEDLGRLLEALGELLENLDCVQILHDRITIGFSPFLKASRDAS